MKKSFSLSSLFLLTAIVALTMSQIVMWWRLADANAELDLNRRRFGHIQVDDESQTYVSRIAEPNASISKSYRIRVPAGSRYLLHLSDTTFIGEGYPVNPTPTKTISLNGWRDGADAILSYYIRWDNNAPRLIAHSETGGYFDYVPSNWISDGQGESLDLETNPQNVYSTDETIEFMWWRDSTTKRGLMLWLEPHSKWHERRLSKKAAAEKTDVNGQDASK